MNGLDASEVDRNYKRDGGTAWQGGEKPTVGKSLTQATRSGRSCESQERRAPRPPAVYEKMLAAWPEIS